MVQLWYSGRLLIVIVVVSMLLIYHIAPNSLSHSPKVAVQADLFPWLTDFTYQIDAPKDAKQLANKTAEKYYTLYRINYELLGTKVGAVIVKIHLKSKPMNGQETQIDFTVKAKHVYAKNERFNMKKEKAEVNGSSTLNSKTDKLSILIPWAEIFKNM